MGKIKVPHTFPVPPLNKGTLNSLKITEPSSERSTEQGTFGGSLVHYPKEITYKHNKLHNLQHKIHQGFLEAHHTLYQCSKYHSIKIIIFSLIIFLSSIWEIALIFKKLFDIYIILFFC